MLFNENKEIAFWKNKFKQVIALREKVEAMQSEIRRIKKSRDEWREKCKQSRDVFANRKRVEKLKAEMEALKDSNYNLRVSRDNWKQKYQELSKLNRNRVFVMPN